MRPILWCALLFTLFCCSAAFAQVEPELVSITPAQGPTDGGTEVTINITPGEYLCAFDPCSGAELLIGGIVVPYTMPNSTTLVAITPPHVVGLVDVELRPGIGTVGTSSVLLDAFAYLNGGVPALSEFATAALIALLGVASVSCCA